MLKLYHQKWFKLLSKGVQLSSSLLFAGYLSDLIFFTKLSLLGSQWYWLNENLPVFVTFFILLFKCVNYFRVGNIFRCYYKLLSYLEYYHNGIFPMLKCSSWLGFQIRLLKICSNRISCTWDWTQIFASF